MTPLDAFLAAGRATAAADRAFKAAAKRASEVAEKYPAARPISAHGNKLVDRAWIAKDRASLVLARAERALVRTALAYDASLATTEGQ